MDFSLFFLVGISLFLLFNSSKSSTQIHIEVSWNQFLELVRENSKITIFFGQASRGKVAHAIFLKSVWYICFERITNIERLALPESRLLRVKKIHGIRNAEW